MRDNKGKQRQREITRLERTENDSVEEHLTSRETRGMDRHKASMRDVFVLQCE